MHIKIMREEADGKRVITINLTDKNLTNIRLITIFNKKRRNLRGTQ